MSTNPSIDAPSGESGSHYGPFFHDGDLYVVGELPSNNGDVRVAKTSDGGATAWTNLDDAGAPGHADGIHNVAAVMDGDILHIITMSDLSAAMTPTFDLEYHTFDMSIDEYVIINEVALSGETLDLVAPGEFLEVGIRSDGDIIVLHPVQGTDMGSGFLTAAYSRREVTTWTNNINISGTDPHTASTWKGVMAPGDEYHIYGFADNPAINDLIARTLDSGNSLSTAITLDDTDPYTGFPGLCRPITWDNGGTQQVLLSWADFGDGRYYTRRASEDGSGDIQNDLTREQLSGTGPSAMSIQIGLAWDTDQNLAWACYNGVDDGYYNFATHGDGWDTEVDFTTGQGFESWLVYYERDGGRFLGILLCNSTGSSTALAFTEIVLEAAVTRPTPFLHRPPRHVRM